MSDTNKHDWVNYFYKPAPFVALLLFGFFAGYLSRSPEVNRAAKQEQKRKIEKEKESKERQRECDNKQQTVNNSTSANINQNK